MFYSHAPRICSRADEAIGRRMKRMNLKTFMRRRSTAAAEEATIPLPNPRGRKECGDACDWRVLERHSHRAGASYDDGDRIRPLARGMVSHPMNQTP